ncbi:hypothetical protein P7F88_04885 [Vibrio hannami]|uniref:hypothetical protein n=1 Tax=Vibrio hannami TaxID=2717094 RepID=UPI00240FA4A5|nr:hypothetical protein [Vibrio hannami]MDG3085470.1 hypothetical protein [Vibrio hannami]
MKFILLLTLLITSLNVHAQFINISPFEDHRGYCPIESIHIGVATEGYLQSLIGRTCENWASDGHDLAPYYIDTLVVDVVKKNGKAYLDYEWEISEYYESGRDLIYVGTLSDATGCPANQYLTDKGTCETYYCDSSEAFLQFSNDLKLCIETHEFYEVTHSCPTNTHNYHFSCTADTSIPDQPNPDDTGTDTGTGDGGTTDTGSTDTPITSIPDTGTGDTGSGDIGNTDNTDNTGGNGDSVTDTGGSTGSRCQFGEVFQTDLQMCVPIDKDITPPDGDTTPPDGDTTPPDGDTTPPDGNTTTPDCAQGETYDSTLNTCLKPVTDKPQPDIGNHPNCSPQSTTYYYPECKNWPSDWWPSDTVDGGTPPDLTSDSDIKALANQIQDMQTDLNTSLDAMALQQQIDKTELSNNIQALNTSVNENGTKVDAGFDKMQTEITTLNDSITTLDTNTTNSMASMETSIAGIQESAAKIESNLDKIANADVSNAGSGACINTGTCKGFYESKYPNGINGVLDKSINTITTQTFKPIVDGFSNIEFSGDAPSFVLDMSGFGFGQYDLNDYVDFSYVWAFVRFCMIFSTIFLCRQLVFGG